MGRFIGFRQQLNPYFSSNHPSFSLSAAKVYRFYPCLATDGSYFARTRRHEQRLERTAVWTDFCAIPCCRGALEFGIMQALLIRRKWNKDFNGKEERQSSAARRFSSEM